MSIKWELKQIDVKELKGYKDNPRDISDVADKNLKRSLETFGQAVPLIVDKDLTVIGGNQRMRHLKGKVWVSVPSRKLSQDEVKKMVVALNQNIGDWDWEKLFDMGWDIEQLALDFGFDTEQLNSVKFSLEDFDFDGFDNDNVIKKIIFNFRREKESLGLIEKAKEKYGTKTPEDILMYLIEEYEKDNS